MLDIAIIGAGLSGLSLADRLLEDNRHIAVFEARNRYGGRILSRSIESGVHGFICCGRSWAYLAMARSSTAHRGVSRTVGIGVFSSVG